MDAASFAELARWIRHAVSVEGLHLSVLRVSSPRKRDAELFSRVFEFWKTHWFRQMKYETTIASVELQKQLEKSYIDMFLSADKIILLTTMKGILAVGTLHYLDLGMLSQKQDALLSSFGAGWSKMHEDEGVRTIYYATNLVADPAVVIKGPSAALGRLCTVAIMCDFLASGLDMALCRMRRKTQMDKHGEFVGAKKEGEVYVPGKGDEVGDIMTIHRDTAMSFPFGGLGPSFGQLWRERATAWHQARRHLAKL